MSEFTGHEGQASVIVRGSMHHAVMTVSEFEAWLLREDCLLFPWPFEDACAIYRRDGSVRSTAIKLDAGLFEPRTDA